MKGMKKLPTRVSHVSAAGNFKKVVAGNEQQKFSLVNQTEIS